VFGSGVDIRLHTKSPRPYKNSINNLDILRTESFFQEGSMESKSL